MAWIDDMVEKHRLNNSVIFKIDDTIESFTKSNCRSEFDPLPMRLPFQSIVLSFNNAFITFFEMPEVNGTVQIWTNNSYYKNGPCEYETSNNKYSRVYETGNNGIYHHSLWYPREKPRHDFFGNGLTTRKEREKRQGDATEDVYRFSALIAFLNVLSCKNITYERVDPPAKIQKKRAKRGKPPLHSYYTLKIRTNHCHMHRGNDGKKAWSNRAHLCRGHIKNYTDDKPLFGKIAGKVWCPPHVKGNARLGLIHKRYEV